MRKPTVGSAYSVDQAVSGQAWLFVKALVLGSCALNQVFEGDPDRFDAGRDHPVSWFDATIAELLPAIELFLGRRFPSDLSDETGMGVLGASSRLALELHDLVLLASARHVVRLRARSEFAARQGKVDTFVSAWTAGATPRDEKHADQLRRDLSRWIEYARAEEKIGIGLVRRERLAVSVVRSVADEDAGLARAAVARGSKHGPITADLLVRRIRALNALEKQPLDGLISGCPKMDICAVDEGPDSNSAQVVPHRPGSRPDDSDPDPDGGR